MGGMEAIDPRYGPLYERVRTVLGADPRVKQVVLTGSVAAGTADRWSDLDLQVVSHDTEADYDGLVADWPRWLEAITPTVFSRTPIAPFVINTLTDDGLTLDLAIYRGEPFTPPAPAAAAANPEYVVGMMSARRFADLGDALDYAVAEQLRGLAGPFISLLKRDEHVRHLTGLPHLLGLLTTVFLAETGAPPPAKHWNRTFSEEQRAAVAGLPPVSATEAGITAFGLGLAELLVTRARPLFPRYGLEWPSDLAAVVRDRVAAELDLDISAWLF